MHADFKKNFVEVGSVDLEWNIDWMMHAALFQAVQRSRAHVVGYPSASDARIQFVSNWKKWASVDV